MEKLPEEEMPYDSEICCVAISGMNKIRVICQPHNDYLKDSLVKISNSVVDASKYTVAETEQSHGWNVHKLTYNHHYWSHTSSSALITGRLLIGRIIFHFGKENGWSFLVNGNVKDTADYVWFVRDKHQMSIYKDVHSFGGFEIPSNADCAILTPNSTDKLRAYNFPDRIAMPLKDLISTMWEITEYRPNEDYPNCNEFKLKGYPWWCSGIKAVKSRLLIMKIMTFLLGE